MAVLIGNNSANNIDGTENRDIIFSRGGADVINSGGGNDVIVSGSGADIVDAGEGNDVVLAGSGDDKIDGGAGNDFIAGGTGNDEIDAGEGNDVVLGGRGDDKIDGGAGNDFIAGGKGNDEIDAGEGHDVVLAGRGDDKIDGGAGNDFIAGGKGNDEINGGSGCDIVLAGRGNDTVIHNETENSNSYNFYSGGRGYDTIRLAVTQATFDSAAFQADLARFQLMIDQAGSASGFFASLNIMLVSFEAIEVVIEGGGNQPPTITTTDPVAVSEGNAGSSDVVTVTIADHVTIDDPDAGDTPVPYAGGLALKSTSGPAPSGGLEPLFTLDAVTGVISYDRADFDYLAAGDTVTATFTFDAASGPDTVPQTATITITGANDGPSVAAAVVAGAGEDDPGFNVDLLSGASDPDTSDTLNVANLVLTGGDASGVTASGNSLAVDPSAYNHLAVGESAVVTYSYDIVDGNGGTVAQSATVTITGANDGPSVASAVVAGAGEDDAGFTVDLLSGASDPDTSDTLTVANLVLTGGDASGITASGNSLAVDPNAYNYLAVGESEVVTYSYDIVDGNGGTVPQTATITITGANDGPSVAAAVVAGAGEDDPGFNVDLLSGASDPDTSDTLTVANLVLTGGDASGITASGNSLTVDPNAYNYLAVGESAVVTYSYDIEDGNGGTVPQTATITITGANDGPSVAAAVVAGVGEDDPAFNVDLLSGASDPDTSDTLTVANLVLTGGDASGIIASGNSLAVDPNAYNYLAVGESEVVTYSYDIVDGNGGTVPQSATITITGENDGPSVASAVVAGAGEDDAGFTVDLLSGASDPDTSDTLTVANLVLTGGDASGITVSGNSLTVDPSAYNYLAVGESEVVTYSYDIVDGNGGTVAQSATITITGENDGPSVASAVVAGAGEDAGVFNVDLLSGASDPDTSDTLNVANLVLTGGNVSGIIASGNSLAVDPDAYNDLAVGESEVVTYSYDIVDGNGGTVPQTATVTITGENDGPIATNSVAITNMDKAISGTLTGTDPDSSDTLVFSLGTDASNGTVSIQADGSFIYTPNSGFIGNDSFTFLVDDGTAAPVEGTVTVNVAGTGTDLVFIDSLPSANEQVSSVGSQDNPEVAALGDGGHIVVWSSLNQAPDGSGWGVFAQRYDAAGDKVGAEFLVNTTKIRDQLDPSVAGITGGALDGGFVVVWQSLNQAPDSSGYGVFAQRYDAAGNKAGGEFPVNLTMTSNQWQPSVTALADGQFAVSWTDLSGADGSGYGVFVRVFDADGTALTPETRVNQTTASTQDTEGGIAETITTLDDGGFVVSWTSYDGSATSERYDAYVRVFNADGTARSDERQVNSIATSTNYDQRFVSVGALVGTDAGFVVTWTDRSTGDIIARVYDQDGYAVDDDFLVNTYTLSTQQLSKVAGLADGGFVIVWQSYGVDGTGTYTIAGQRHDAAGNRLGGEFIIPELSLTSETEPSIDLRDDGGLIVSWKTNNNRIEQKIITDFETDVSYVLGNDVVSMSSNTKDNPEVAKLGDGGHIVVWSSSNQAPDGNGWGVFAQRYDAAGDKVGTEFLVNTTTSSNQVEPSVAGITGGALDGGFVVVWQSFNQAPDSSSWGVFGQRYDAAGNKVGGEFLVNQTKANYQWHPSVTALAGGQFAVSWTDSNSTDGDGYGVFVRVFNADGTALNGEIQVNQTTANTQDTEGTVAETITTLDDGGFVVSWTSYDGSAISERFDAYIRVFNADGTARSDEIPVNSIATSTNFDQRYVSVGALVGTDAGFVATWTDRNTGDISARVHDQDGNAVGNDFLVNTYTNNTQQFSKVVGLADGGFVIVWNSYGADGSSTFTITGQRYDAAGNRLGGEFIIPESSIASINEYIPSVDVRADGAVIVTWKAENSRIEQKIITDFETDVSYVFGNDVVSTSSNTKDNPEVAVLGDGGHIVVWSSSNQVPDGSGWGVFAQRYDAAGYKVGTEFLVNTTTGSNQFDPSVAGITGGTLDGGFVVVWQSFNQAPDSSVYGVFGQRYDAAGNKVGGEFPVNQTKANYQWHPSVTALADGRFAVSWTDQSGADSDGYGVFVRVFDADGTALTDEKQVNQTTVSIQVTDGFVAETITTLDDGGFVVSWTSDDGSATSERHDAYIRVFNADGTVRSDEIQVNSIATNTNYDQRLVSVGALVRTDAGFVVTWTDFNSGDVFARVHDQDGHAVGDDFQVNTYTNSTQQISKVAGLADGGFVIVWQSYGADGTSSYTITGQRYDAAGNELGGEFIIPELSLASEIDPSIDLRDDGALIVAWKTTNNRIEQKIIDFDAQGAAKNVAGGDGNDTFIGSQYDDTFDGGAGNDRAQGSDGNDLLTGGPDADTFVFEFASEGIDTITDFESGIDTLEVSAAGFGSGLTAGGSVTLVTAASVEAASSAGSDGFFIFDNDGANAGTLYWDPTGGTSEDAVTIAQLENLPTLTQSDFDVV